MPPCHRALTSILSEGVVVTALAHASRRPCRYEEQFYTNYGPTSYVSPSKRSPSTLPPLGGKNMGRSASTPSMPTSMRGAQHPTWSADHADPNHVDHSLEMFRTGHGAGGAYKFDGEVAASGAGDSKPVTDYELECVSSLGLSNPSSNRSSSPFLSPRRWVHTMSRARSTSPLVAGARSHTRQAEDALLVIPRSVPVCVCLC